jgi:hypothetical protein
LFEICAASPQIRFAQRNEKLASESLARRPDETRLRKTYRHASAIKSFPELSGTLV